ncbi:MAG TPA: HipA domain-containing protein, partial [Candidatus Aquilonibacter sp.]|nr:HipA domain-containing protein [Candidatus Aquilonibacter sp.]
DAVLPQDEDREIVSQSIERDPHVLKFSLAGVQLKFSAIREAEGGLTIPVHGKGGTWIAKMPSSTYPYVPENEHTMLSFARHLGIEVPEIGLINAAQIGNMPPQVRTDLGNALYVKRFDRVAEQRIHIEDFAQIFGLYPTHRDKYDRASVANILEFLWRATSHNEVEEFVRRLVFSIGIGNGDMHVKNWSVVYSDTRTPRLTPAYDYVSTIVYIPNDDVGLSIARTKSYENIDMERMERLARRAGVPRGLVFRATRDMVERINSEWMHLNDDGLLPQRMVDEITAHRDRVPLLRGVAAHPVEVDLSPQAGPIAPADDAAASGAETEIA